MHTSLAPAPDDLDHRGDAPTRRRRSRWVRGGGLVAAAALAGTLFWGVPSGGRDDLPDPAAMRAAGSGYRTSAENVAFWARRVDAVPTSVAFRAELAAAELVLAADSGDLARFENAERTARRALELDPTHERARLVLADAVAGQHRFAEAAGLGAAVLADRPGSVAALLTVGDASLAVGDHEAARRHYAEAAASVGGEAAIVARSARLEAEVGRLDEARRLARTALVRAGEADLRPTDAAFYWFQAAHAEFLAGRYGDAHDLLRSALSIDPDHGGAGELHAKVLVALGDEAGAIAAYEALVAGGGAADLHGNLALLYRRSGRVAEADEQVRLGLAVAEADADRFPAERRHLVGFLVEHDPVEALRLAELDLVDRQDVDAHAWVAWARFRLGDVAGAVDAIEPALRIGTERAMVRFQAGAILAADGQIERARVLLEAAIDTSPQFHPTYADEARGLLAGM